MTRLPPTTTVRTAKANPALWFFTAFAAVWNTIIMVFLVGDETFREGGFKWLFIGAGILVSWVVITGWRERLRGGVMTLKLSEDPAPISIPFTATFTPHKALAARDWKAELTIERERTGDDSSQTLWQNSFPVTALSERLLRAQLIMPASVPATLETTKLSAVRCTLTLSCELASWQFALTTRAASPQERLQNPIEPIPVVATIDPELAVTPAQRARRQRLVRLWRLGVAATLLVLLGNFIARFHTGTGLLDWLQQRSDIGYYHATGTSEPFPLRLSNWNSNQWGIQAQLQGTGHIRNGQLVLQIDSLALRKMHACNATETDEHCRVQIKSVSLLLTEPREGYFHTAATSEPLPIEATLQGTETWRLAATTTSTLTLALPNAVLKADQSLRLTIEESDGSSYHPEAETLQLQRVLAAAHGNPDPCTAIDGLRSAFDAGCHERLRELLATPSSSWQVVREQWSALLAAALLTDAPANERDALLIDAIKLERYEVIEDLLQAGANPNTLEPDNPHKTAVGLAAEFDRVDVLQQLVRHGGKTDQRLLSESGVSWTPLKLAARRDSVAALRWLLAAGAPLQDDDQQGWTALHIAARASAVSAIELLVASGANVNARSKQWRQETPLMTALRDGDAATIAKLLTLGADASLTDNEHKNACDWARFFQRGPDIVTQVCDRK